MTTVDDVLLKLDYLTKEQEEQLTFLALDDVIDTFENTFWVSEAGIPLVDSISFNPYLGKQESSDEDIDEEDEKTKKELEELSARADIADEEIRNYIIQQISGTRNKARRVQLVSILLTGLIDQQNEIAETISNASSLLQKADEDYSSREDIEIKDFFRNNFRGSLFPKSGFRFNPTDPKIGQVRVMPNADGTFKMQAKPVTAKGQGKWKTVKGGEKVNGFDKAMRLAERKITDDARKAGVDIPNPYDPDEVNPWRKREALTALHEWLGENVAQDFRGPMGREQSRAGKAARATGRGARAVGGAVKDISSTVAEPWTATASPAAKFLKGRFYANMSAISRGASSGWKKGWEKGVERDAKRTPYRAPNSEQYQANPKKYWETRGKLVSMYGRAENTLQNSISNINSKQGEMGEKERNTKIMEAMISHAKSMDTIEVMARGETGSSLGAIKAHFDQIRSGNPNAMPPGEYWPNAFGGDPARRKLLKNPEKFGISTKPVKGSNAWNRLAERLQGLGERGRELDPSGQGPGVGQSAQPASSGDVPTEYREYVKTEDEVPDGAVPKRAERRGPDGKQAIYYDRRLTARKQDEKLNGADTNQPPISDGSPVIQPPAPNLEGERERMEGAGLNLSEEDEMAIPNGQQPPKIKSPKEVRNENFQAAVENEVMASKQAQQKANARSAKSRAKIAVAKAEEAEVKARRAEEDRDAHIAELLTKLDNNINNIQIKSNPEISQVYTQLDETINTIEKQNPFSMLTGNMSRAFKAQSAPSKKKKEASTGTEPTTSLDLD